jgi:hypothetical protein
MIVFTGPTDAARYSLELGDHASPMQFSSHSQSNETSLAALSLLLFKILAGTKLIHITAAATIACMEVVFAPCVDETHLLLGAWY